MKQAATSPRLGPPLGWCALAMLWVLAAWGCGGSGGSTEGTGIQNVSQSAPSLEDRDDLGNYQPYFATGDMVRPRYMHEAVFARSGFVVAMGGSDERGLSALDTVEFYDQSTFDQNAPRPESETGVWFDTDFEGDPIVFETGPRLFFTMDELADGEIIVIGGTSNILTGSVRSKAEIFMGSVREFETLDDEMIEPRFRHTTSVLNDGSLLISGGQTLDTVTVIVENFLANQQMQVSVFESEKMNEVFSPTEQAFEIFTAGDTQREVELNTPRGRADHDTNRMAGPDGILNSGDDVFILAGGFQTLSAQFAPQNKLPGSVGQGRADSLRSIEIFDPTTNVLTQVGNVSLADGRIDSPHIVNLGEFNDFTIDGVLGMGNAILITHGNNDDFCPETGGNVTDEVFVASFTGFGPAQGLQIFQVEDQANASHVQGSEYSSVVSPAAPPFNPGVLGLTIGGGWVGRCMTNPVALPRRMVTVDDVDNIGTWVFSLSGLHIVDNPLADCTYFHTSDVMDAGCVFDPFYSVQAGVIGNSTRDLTVGRSGTNPLGILGAQLVLDGAIPTVDFAAYGTTPVANWGATPARRVYPVNLPVPGEDGIINTPDDRILLTGGGADGRLQGEEPTNPSAVIFLPPGANEKQPSP